MQADYDAFTNTKHFWRIGFADVYYETEDNINDIKFVYICGDCAWSVHSCMRRGLGTYAKDDDEHSTSLAEQSELLNLEIEVFSSEPGVGFQEHYLYKNGEETIDDVEDYTETYFENEEDFNRQKADGFVLADFYWEDVNENGDLTEGSITDWGIFNI